MCNEKIRLLPVQAIELAKRWRSCSTGELFVGIDDIAIDVSKTEASLVFYQDSLALELLGESFNNDLWHWDITMVVADATAAAERLQQAGVPLISSCRGGSCNAPTRRLPIAPAHCL
ncbi:VOC family protein [Leptothoe spongobia]|uniref:Uncharacterized protein n=1 Tax=Leptothoe spongobia TAU-MAC 1115 TaxID=1967444 RepID=A0A947GKL0_9CYAN|nr:hypothetical protein [Leptothoe spongobia]MBT9314246.1 hypothetical protein [Leptothoe spongobia TAU-MAC 1115]